MFCPTCGNQVAETLTYCNRCGARLNAAIEKSDNQAESGIGKVLQNFLIWMSIVMLTTLVMAIGLVVILLDKNFNKDFLGLMLTVYLMAGFGICFLLARQTSRVLDAYLKQQEKNPLSQSSQTAQPFQIPGRNTAQIEEPKEPFISITENTTRTLDSALQERAETRP